MSGNSHSYRPVIYGLERLAVTDEEAAFFRDARPWGLILFARNIESREQLLALTNSLREQSGNPNLPILIDQEGGRVARVKPPIAPLYPPMGVYGEIYKQDKARGLEAARLGAALLAQDLHRLGINVTCAPCLDLRLEGMSGVIGDRAFGEDVETIVALGRAVMDGLVMGGVLPVVKHMPGHGRAAVDSHFELPLVDADITTLQETDFAVFRQLNDAPLGMTGHLRFNAIDAAAPSTLSKTLIDGVIRDFIGFDGVLMSDDISMQALSGDLGQLSEKALAAGCDLILHCNGRADEMQAVQATIPDKPNAATQQRLDRAEAALAALTCKVPADARKVWGELMGDAAVS